MKLPRIKLPIFFWVAQLMLSWVYAQTDAVLQPGDLPGLEIEKTEPSIGQGWWPADGIRQYAVLRGVKVMILYAFGNSAEEAHQMALAYSTNMASTFHFGSWPGGPDLLIGDESWYGRDPSGTALLYRSGRTCVFMGCAGQIPENRPADVTTQLQAVESLAENVDQQIPILEAQVKLRPKVLKVRPGVLTAFVKLPEGYPANYITAATCDGAPATKMKARKKGEELVIKFRRKDIEAALARVGSGIDTNFVVSGTWLNAGQTNFFRGTAGIKRIIGENEKVKDKDWTAADESEDED